MFLMIFNYPMCNAFKYYNYSNGYKFILLWITIAFQADNGALFFGKLFGKNKFSPNISPGKTWEGVYGAVLLAIGNNIVVSMFNKYKYV